MFNSVYIYMTMLFLSFLFFFICICIYTQRESLGDILRDVNSYVDVYE